MREKRILRNNLGLEGNVSTEAGKLRGEVEVKVRL